MNRILIGSNDWEMAVLAGFPSAVSNGTIAMNPPTGCEAFPLSPSQGERVGERGPFCHWFLWSPNAATESRPFSTRLSSMDGPLSLSPSKGERVLAPALRTCPLRTQSRRVLKVTFLAVGFLAVSLTLSLAQSSARAAESAAAKPNVLFIAIDDLNDWVGCLGGHPQAQTPNMDSLAARGTLFRNAHCQAPLCNPSRASLLTGLRPSTTGIYGLVPGIRDVARTRDCVTLPQYFAQHGYLTAGFGKVFHDGSIPERLHTNEFNVWGPAPSMPLPTVKFVQTPATMRLMDWGVYPKDDREQADWKIADAAIAQFVTRFG